MSSCKCIPPIPVLTYIANGIDTSQTDTTISIADQEAFYDEVMYGESSKSLVNRYDQEAFYEEIIRIEQVPLRDLTILSCRYPWQIRSEIFIRHKIVTRK